jgi:small subunit ribosomal protein S6
MKKKENRLYEGMYILSATLSDDARQKALDKICHGIEEKGGEIHKIHHMGRRHLAYEIMKKREGYYELVYFSLDPQLEKELWKEYHLHEDLLRFMTLKADKILETLEFKPLKSES